MTDIFKLFLEISVMASVMIGIILIIRRAFSKKMNPAVMLILWGMVIVRLILPFTIASPVHFGDLIPEQSLAINSSNEVLAETDHTIAAVPAVNEPNLIQPNTQITVQETSQADAENTSILATEQAKATLRNILLSIPIWSLLAVIWLVGAATVLFLTTWNARRFKVKLRFCTLVTDKRILETIRHHKKDLGIKRGITVYECDFVQAPSVFGYFKPCILMPSSFVKEMDRNSLNAILLHEVNHIRCHDILKNYIWLVAKALHWFNPLVWIAYKKFEDDIELCRDHKVALQLDEDGTFVYSRSLVKAARVSNHNRVCAPPMATSLFASKCKLKDRVIRLVKPHRKTKTSAMATSLLALLMIIACFTTACQPTPEVEAVVGRQEDVLENVNTVAPDDFEPIEVPDHISEVYDDFPYLKITYDADVIVPETTAYPVTEVTKKVFSEEDILSYIDLFIDGDYEMYVGWALTKDDYMSMLTKAKQYEGTERITQDILDRLQEVYDKATNDVENPQIMSLSELPTDHAPHINIRTPEGTISDVAYEREGNYIGYRRDGHVAAYPASSVTDALYTENLDGEIENYRWKQPGEPDISQENAYAIALEYKDKLGIDLDLYSVELCSFIKDYVDKTTGWQFEFTRTISNLKTIQDTGGTYVNPDAAPSYAAPWGEENLIISVDKSGLFSFGWSGASEINSTIVESAQLIDFDTIKQRITNQLNYIYSTWGEDQDTVFEIKIIEIELGVCMLSVKDETELGEYIPTWYVTYKYGFADTDEDEWEIRQSMFSAIDGSYVEPRITNDDLMGNMDIGSEQSSSDSSL